MVLKGYMGGTKDISEIVLPANASWADHAVLYVLKDPQNFFGWLAAVFVPLLFLSACASYSLMKDMDREERRNKRVERRAARNGQKTRHAAIAQAAAKSGAGKKRD